MAENQEQLKPKEREIPVFTVLKNNCILKNIFLLDNPPSISPSPPSSFPVAENVDQESEMEEVLLVGRHPDCNIKLEHPSISRFHLRIHSKPSFRSLFVTDLSSVHGTWISGNRIEPGVRMKLNEGDTLRLGASSRLYRLNWVPISRAYDIDNPFVPQLDDADSVEEETEEEMDQERNISSGGNDQVEIQIPSENIDGLERLFSDEDLDSSLQKMSLMPEDLYNSFSSEVEVEKNSSPGIDDQENELSSGQLCEFDKENSTPSAEFPLEEVSAVSQLETMEISEMMNSEKKSGVSIWSRRGKPESVQIETRFNMSSQVKSFVGENQESESILKDHCASPDNEEEIFTPDKENASSDSLLFRSLKSKSEETLKSESISNAPISSVDQDDEIFTPDKENMTPNSNLFRSMKNIESLGKNPKSHRSSPLKMVYNSNMDQEEAKEIFTPDKENMTQIVIFLGP
ncbi:hypothetical protein DH2020_049623 [Rehmannia glutinosa]|uniref:FHA domain-containing protein n=1 Tax=Rehmannia glutinosa TaxID=99300 RepID=A0ABR0U2S0_REHGL